MNVDWVVEPKDFDAIRLAGRVTRYHTIPGCDQTVAAHSWGVATIILHYFPKEASAELLKAALYHDAPEEESGDIPADFKWANQPLVAILDRAEDDWHERNGTNTVLTEREKEILKLADRFELLWYCYEQACQGNRYAARPFWRVYDLSKNQMSHELHVPLQDLQERMSYLTKSADRSQRPDQRIR